MKKSARISWGIALAVLIGLLVLFFLWFWSLGDAHAAPPPTITIEAVKQPVEWKHGGQVAWAPLTETVRALPGDSIRTGDGGEARVVWGDRGTTRMDSGSALTLEVIPQDGSLNPGANIKLKLESGRVWSRLIKLLDLESSVQVQSSAVVATVRGTSFGAAEVPGGVDFAVTQSVVDVSATSSSRTLLTDNRWGDFDTDANPRTVRSLLPSDQWAEQNRAQDAQEERDELALWRTRLEADAAPLNNAPAFLLDASESLHLWFLEGGQQQIQAATYAERRLARISIDNRPEDIARYRSYITTAGPERSRLLADWHGLATLRAHTGEGDVNAARTMRDELAPDSTADRLYLDAVAIDDRIDDVLASSTRDQPLVDGIRADIDAFEAKIDPLHLRLDEETGLHRKAEALRARIEGIGNVSLPTAPEIPLLETPPTPGTQVPDPAKRPPLLLKPAPTTSVAPTQPSYVRYQLLASPSSVVIGQTVKLTMFGITSTGQADDLTAATTFSAPSQSGTISGATFTPAVAGTITVSGTVNGVVASAGITVTRTATVTATGLQSLAFQFTGPTVMGCSAYSAFKLIATYTDGKTADVTMLSKLSVTDPKLIYVNVGSVMSFCTADVATADVDASYTENQVTKTTAETITVARDPAAVTKDCKLRRGVGC
jgi:hypothetical protein